METGAPPVLLIGTFLFALLLRLRIRKRIRGAECECKRPQQNHGNISDLIFDPLYWDHRETVRALSPEGKGSMNKRLFAILACLMVLLSCPFAFAINTAWLTADTANGQTFLTWQDVSGAQQYKVYRSTTPFLGVGVSAAKKVAQIAAGSSYNKYWDLTNQSLSNEALGFATAVGSKNFRIAPLGTPLADNVELFVWTTQEAGGGQFYYAVTAVVGGVEDLLVAAGNTVGPVKESECKMIMPVEQARSSDGTGHVYMMWMPYDKWNPAFEGYAYPFYLAGTGTQKKKVDIQLHYWGGHFRYWMGAASSIRDGTSFGTIGEEHLLYFDDPRLTWHYGFADSLVSNAAAPNSTVKNYTEYRYWCAIRWLCSGKAPVLGDSNEVYLRGLSMGGTGSFTFSIHHPEIFSYVNTSMVGCNNWITLGTLGGQVFDSESAKFGKGKVLRCVDLISHTGLIGNQDVGMSSMGWQSVRDSVLPVIGKRDDVCFYNFAHGTQDNTIEWLSQGMPIYTSNSTNKFASNRIAYSCAWSKSGHVDPVPNGLNPSSLVGKNHFVLALANATSDDSFHVAACRTGLCSDSGMFNARIRWSKIGDAVNPAIDSPTLFETTLTLDITKPKGAPPYSGQADPTVDITPRRLRNLVHTPGTVYSWKNIPAGSAAPIDSGVTFADAWGLFTIPAFKISVPGNRLRIAITQQGPSINQYIPPPSSLQKWVDFSGSPLRKGSVIRFLPVEGKMPESVRLYTIAGDAIDLSCPEGKGEIVWPGNNLPGNSVAGGVYLIRAKYDRRFFVERIVVAP